jgi:HAD superfamily PSPase-like hydrolase
MTFELIVFDMDGTLIKRPSSWEKLHRYYGTTDKEKRYLEAYLNGEIDYPEFMRKDISSWGDNLHINHISRILLSYEFMDGALMLAEYLSKHKIVKGIITAGLDIVAEDVCKRLKFDFYVANGFEIDDNGYLTGEGILRVEPLRKGDVMKAIIDRMGISDENVISVGDAHYDKGLFEHSRIKIGISDESIAHMVDYLAKDLYEVLDYLRKIL